MNVHQKHSAVPPKPSAVPPGKSGVHLNNSGVHLNNSGVHLNNSGVHLNNSGVHLNNSGVHLREYNVQNTSKLRFWHKDLGIIGPDVAPPDFSTVKPRLNGVVAAGATTIKFDKGDMEGVRIYCKRAAETHFTFLASDTHSPYYDNRPKLAETGPEERQYYAFYFQNDYEIGQQSDIITVVIP
jgi:hypothetical protein